MFQNPEMPIRVKNYESALKKRGLFRLLVSAMRPHQWIKNLFVFAPLLFGRKLTDIVAVENSLATFAAFCLTASSIYIFNDISDIEEDRKHPEKKNRPITSGELSVSFAVFWALISAATGFVIAFAISLQLFFILSAYFVLTLGYCLSFKRIILLDCMTIAAGFVLRVVGGAVAVAVMPTHWLIVCTFLLALFLAFTKRRQELMIMGNEAGGHRAVLDEYSVAYLDQVNNIVIGSITVCYALYTVAPETTARFDTDKLIYGTIFVIYGIFRYLALIKNPENGGNPSKMLLQDKPLILAVAGWTVYNATVIYLPSLNNFIDTGFIR